MTGREGGTMKKCPLLRGSDEKMSSLEVRRNLVFLSPSYNEALSVLKSGIIEVVTSLERERKGGECSSILLHLSQCILNLVLLEGTTAL